MNIRKVVFPGICLLTIGGLAATATGAKRGTTATRIVWSRIATHGQNQKLVTAAPDGSGLLQLTHPPNRQFDIDSSGPTKDLVIFETYGHETPPGESSNVATVPTTCTSLSDCKHQITYLTTYHNGVRAAFNPSWSPDGTRIVYTEFKGTDDDCCKGDIYTMDANGKHRTAVSKSPLFEYRPDWGVAP
jgi:hypothetical protein